MEMHVYQESDLGPGKIVVKGPFDKRVEDTLDGFGLTKCEVDNGVPAYMHDSRGGEDLWDFAKRIDDAIKKHK